MSASPSSSIDSEIINNKLAKTPDQTGLLDAYETVVEDVTDRSWNAIVNVVRSGNRKRINGVVFRYISEQCEGGSKTTTTGEAIEALEQRLRAKEIDLWCLAHPIEPTQQRLARTLRGEPCNYFLTMAVSEQDRDTFLNDNGIDQSANLARLRETGFQTASESKAINGAQSQQRASSGQQQQHLILPDDLSGETAIYFDEASIRFYDPNLSATLLTRHAKAMRAVHTIKERERILSNTGVQVIRTSVAREKWADTRLSIENQARARQPIVEKPIVACVREQVVPLGYHLHGTTTTPLYLGSPDSPVALFDLYCCTLRRYHIQVSQADADVLTSSATDAETLHQLIADRAGTVPEEVSHITSEQLERYVQFFIKE